MTDFSPLIKSHSSARVRQLLASAEVDVPPAGSKERLLVALSHVEHLAGTTNFSGIALGTTVNRLIGAVTLYGSSAGPWQLIGRGSVMGAVAGALALVTIVTLRWAEAPAMPTEAPTLTPSPASPAALHGATTHDRMHAVSDLDASRHAVLRGAAVELDAGRAAIALESLEAIAQRDPDARALPQATVLKVKALVQLGRIVEARAAANPILLAAPSPEAAELRLLLDAPRAATQDGSAK